MILASSPSLCLIPVHRLCADVEGKVVHLVQRTPPASSAATRTGGTSTTSSSGSTGANQSARRVADNGLTSILNSLVGGVGGECVSRG